MNEDSYTGNNNENSPFAWNIILGRNLLCCGFGFPDSFANNKMYTHTHPRKIQEGKAKKPVSLFLWHCPLK